MNSTIRRPALLESAKPGINDPINFLGDLRFLGNRPDLICKGKRSFQDDSVVFKLASDQQNSDYSVGSCMGGQEAGW